MQQALALAQESVGLAHPNPVVGAVLVRDGEVVGRGRHIFDERDHAEIVALREAAGRARGATLYVTLEPCCHTGRTGPCTRAIVQAGVARVVAAMEDPNPRVAGQGFEQLRAAGLQVSAGVGEAEAARLNEDFACWIRTQKPLVTLKSALTLDGKIASKPGEETSITGPVARQTVQQMRHAADAVLTGIGTVMADDPLLTDRTGLPRRRPLLRVVLDSQLRLPPDSQLVRTAKNDLLVFGTEHCDAARAEALERHGAEVIRVAGDAARIDLREVLCELGRREILNVLLEAGAELNGSALAGDLVDKMVLFYAPRILGETGVPFAQLPHGWFANAPALSRTSVRKVGEDFCVEGYFHDVYGHY